MVKAKKKGLSVRSRAARRGVTSPPPNPSAVKSSTGDTTEYSPWLHNAQNAGISKKKKAKPISRQQRLRQQKGLEHAERNMDKLEKKVADSKTRAKRVQARAKQWDELNDKLAGKENRASLKKDDEEAVVKDTEERQTDGVDTSGLAPVEVDMVEEVVEKMANGEPALGPTDIPLPASDAAEEAGAVKAVDEIS